MGLISLVYVSIEAHTLAHDELVEILKKARVNNQKLGITGMLLYRDGFFIQCLEGDEDAVKALYTGIAKDNRHENVLLVYEAEIEKRAFTDWRMGFNRVENSDLNDLEGYSDYLDKPFTVAFFHDNPARAITLLEHFKNRTFF